MNLLNQDQYDELRTELNEYAILCNQYKYVPTKSEFDDIIRFILLYQNGGTTLCESYELNPFKLLNHLYESYGFVNEEGEGQIPYNPEKDFESAYGSVKTGAAFAVAGAAIAAVAVGVYIAYLFKKSKIKGAVQKEMDAEMKKLEGYQKLAELKKELITLDVKASRKINFPGMTSGSTYEPSKDESKKK